MDSTNIVDPLVSIITSIGLDHRETLGNNVYDIASKLMVIEAEGTVYLLKPDINFELP